MLKELLRLAEESTAVSKEIQSNINRTAKEIRTGLKSYFERKEQVRVEVLAPNKAIFMIEFNRWMSSEDIVEMHKDFVDAIKKADTNGHVFKIEDTGSSGEGTVEVLLGGLRKGMKVIPEAFFPTVEYTITWTIVSSRKK